MYSPAAVSWAGIGAAWAGGVTSSLPQLAQ